MGGGGPPDPSGERPEGRPLSPEGWGTGQQPQKKAGGLAHLVSHALAGLHGGDVGVDEDGLDLLLLHRLDGLRAAVVELPRLADRQPAGPQDEHLRGRGAGNAQ